MQSTGRRQSPPGWWPNVSYEDPAVKRWAAQIASADAYIVVSPEYNQGYTAVLKNAVDRTYPEWARKLVGFEG